MEFLATFHTHYGAMRFYKYCQKAGLLAKMKPVPRELSASCGVCVYVKTYAAPKTADHEDMEHCYAVTTDGEYTSTEG